MLKNVMTGRRRTVTQRGHRDVLEPRRDALGADPGGPLPAAAGARHGAGAAAPEGRPELPVDRGGPPARARRRAARAVRPALRRRRVDTPIEDTAVEWSERVAPPRARRRAHDPAAATSAPSTRWRRPGSSTRWRSTRGTPPTSSGRSATSTAPARPSTTPARRTAWATAGSRSRRCATRWPAPRRAGPSRCVNRYVEWHRLPVPLGLLNLEVFRHVLRKQNLLDTELREAPPSARPVPPAAPDEKLRVSRSVDGSGNDLSGPTMGAVGSAFGRNIRPQLPARPVRRAEPGRRQPAAALPRAVPPGTVAEPARGRLDPVPGARLGRPPPPPARRGRRRGAAARRHDLDRTRRTASPERQMRIAGNVPLLRRRPNAHGAGLRQHDVSTGGTAPRSTEPTRTRPASCARARSCG